MTELADRVKAGMAEKNLNNVQLAALCKVKPPTSYNWASGKTKAIKGEPLLLAAKAFGFNPVWLATGKGMKYATPDGHTATGPESKTTVPALELDPWIHEALVILAGLSLEDRRAAVVALRTFVQNIGPPRDGQTLSMAA